MIIAQLDGGLKHVFGDINVIVVRSLKKCIHNKREKLKTIIPKKGKLEVEKKFYLFQKFVI